MTAVDPTCERAVEQARAAAEDEAGQGRVGGHLQVFAEDERVATHLFECNDPAYVGWRWAVTVARPPRARAVTIDDVVLLAGPDSVVAPEWVPFGKRVQPGDLGVGDVLPSPDDDERLVPGYTASDETDLELAPPSWEPGMGRSRVLSVAGRTEAARRWESGDTGPSSAMARSAPQPCATCGFLLPLAGPFGQAFGVCGNAFSPSDGRVVSMSYGCGAHSDTEVERRREEPDIVLDDLGYDDLDSHIEEDPSTPELQPDDNEPAGPHETPHTEETP